MSMLESCAIEFDLRHRHMKRLTIAELEEIDVHHGDKIYWIHSNLNQVDTHKKLIQLCQLPTEVVELCAQTDVIPMVIDTDDALTIQTQCLLSTEIHLRNKVSLGNFIMHLTPHFCFTASSQAVPAVIDFLESAQKSLRYAKTPCFMIFLMLDTIINDFAKILLSVEAIADRMDLRVRKTHKNIYDEVIKLKQHLMRIKRSITALREILLRISGRKMAVVSEDCRLSLSKLSNHSNFVVHEVDSVRDILNSLLSQIENNSMQTLNQSMRILTAFSTIFLPLTLIAGIYGMNFAFMPELHWRFGYLFAISLMVICAAMVLYLFKRMKWF